MAVDRDFYCNIFCGREYDDIDRLLTAAERAIDNVITVTPAGEFQERQFGFAVCAQAEYMGLCGGVEAWEASVSGTARSFSLGSFSMSSGGSSAGGSKMREKGICSAAESYLEKGGLLYRGCGIC